MSIVKHTIGRGGKFMEGIINRFSQIANRKPDKTQTLQAGENERQELMDAIRRTAGELEAVRSRFDLETDFDLVDACILELNSLERRYDYLIKEARRQRIAAY